MSELDLFSFVLPKFKIDKPVRLIELFAGIGAQAKALKRLGVNFEHWRAIEWDKYAMASYNAVHGTEFETQDIQMIHAQDLGIEQRDRYCYIMTYSFPCQDLSIAGHMKGMEKGTGTRSGLLWEVERLLDELDSNLPQVLLMENVPQVIGKKNIKDFQKWRAKLESLGYTNYVQLLNAKDYGIPQNRNRCFMVSLLGEYHYEFPVKRKLTLKLKDLLEDQVDEKYYVSDKAIEYITKRLDKQYTYINPSVAATMCAKGQMNWTGTFIAPPEDGTFVYDDGEKLRLNLGEGIAKSVRQGGRGDMARHSWDLVLEDESALIQDERNAVIHDDGIVNSLVTDGSSPRKQARIIISEPNRKGFDEAKGGDTINLTYQTSTTRRGRVGHGVAQTIQAEGLTQVVVEDE